MSVLARLRQGATERLLGSARSSSYALMGQVALAVAGLANFLLLARLLGPGAYGMVAGALALVLTVGPIAALGADKLCVRDIARDPESAQTAFSHALLTVVIGSSVTAGLLALLHPVVLPQVALGLVLALVVADALANGIMICTSGTRFALGHGRAGGGAMVATSVAKIGAVGVFALTGGSDPARWATWYAGFAMMAAILSATWTFRAVGRPILRGYRPIARAREGVPYSLNVTATVAQNDVDKTLLVRSGFSEEAGLYSVAYRLATMAWLPILAVLQATLPRFFAMGEKDGISATASFARQLMRPLTAYGVFAAVVLALVAPLIPILVGEEYRGSVTLLLLLSPLALIKVAQYVPSDALTGAGHQPLRTACIATSMGLNLVLGLIFIPRFGVVAALVATFIAEVTYIVLIRVAIRYALRQDGNNDRPHASVSTGEAG
jgi:O-antigen/teichoic acid export membrane protein